MKKTLKAMALAMALALPISATVKTGNGKCRQYC